MWRWSGVAALIGEPFTEEFYLNVKIISRILFFAEYLLIVLGELYFSIDKITFNYFTAKTFVLFKVWLMMAIVFGLCLG